MIGLVGAHRVGKTTLARKYADESGLKFLETSTSSVFEKMGLSPKLDYEFTTRLTIQQNILAHYAEIYEAENDTFITDRTPIDLLAYTMADISRATPMQSVVQDQFWKYVKSCFDLTNQHFSVLVLIQPGIKIVDDPRKAPPSLAYMEHLNAIMKGLMMEEKIQADITQIHRKVVDLNARMNALDVTMLKAQERVINHRTSQGIEVH